MKKVHNKIIIICIVVISVLITALGFKSKTESHTITLNKNDIILSKGEMFTIKPKEDGKYKYESNNEKIAESDSDGNVIAMGVGETTIKVISEDGYSTECKIVVESVDNKIFFTEEKIELELNKKKKLKYEILGNNYEVRNEKWTSSNSNVVEVKDGQIEAKKIGKSTITLTLNDLISIECDVNVIVKVDKLEFKKSKVTIEQGQIASLDYNIKPKNVTEKKLTWTSDDEKIATVDKYGNITGKEKGETVVRVESENGKKDSIKVKVKEVNARSIRLNKTRIDKLYPNKTVNLKATISPANTSDTTVKWSSSDKSIATVSNGKVVAKKPGKVKITAKTSNGKTSTCTIYVRNNTYEKSAIFFGDSITYGFGSTPVGYGWGEYIRYHYEIGTVVTEGHSGWLISNSLNEKWLNTVVKKYSGKSYDYVILHGGTNDISRGVELGEYSAKDFSGNYDSNTFLGGLETYIYTVKKQFPKAKIGYIINYETPNNNDNRKNLSPKYYTEMKKVLEKWKISYLDLYFGKSSDGTKYSDILKVNTNEYLPDTLHLNRAGYRAISPYIYSWMNNL